MIDCKIETNTTINKITHPKVSPLLSDIQDQPDTRGIAIQKVGIQSLEYPIRIFNHLGIEQSSIGLFTLSISLSPHKKGAHLSRFIGALEAHPRVFSSDGRGLSDLLILIQKTLEAENAFLNISFPFFMEKSAPKTHLNSLMRYNVTFTAEKLGTSDAQWETCVEVPVTSVCPCSKAISRYGAHNQRSILRLTVKTVEAISIERWITLLEQQGSAELFSLLKRPDEKWVTEKAYENAKFVEDIVRDVACILNHDNNIMHYHISSNNLESIHNHSAYAEIFNKKLS